MKSRFAEATIDTPETRDQLFEYFVDKVFIGREQIVIASYFYDSAGHIEFEDLEEALATGNRAGEVRTYARKREFNTSPSGGDGGNRTGPAQLQGFHPHRWVLRHLGAIRSSFFFRLLHLLAESVLFCRWLFGEFE